MKDEDLAKQMPIGGDVPTLLQQQNHCTVRTFTTGNVPATLYKMYHTSSVTLRSSKFPLKKKKYYHNQV